MNNSILLEMLNKISTQSIKVIDLSHTLNEQSPVIHLPEPFANAQGFKFLPLSRYDETGPFFYWNDFIAGEHCGTHFDAPIHWLTGKGLNSVDTFSPQDMIAHACVIDLRSQCADDPDYCLTIADIEHHEAQYGEIPAHSWILLHTGWARYIHDHQAFFNIADDQSSHTPGLTVEAAKYLSQRPEVIGVGVETVGTDAGLAGSFDPPFPCHHFMHKENKYGLASLNNLDQLPARGAIIIATPLKIEAGSGSPVRAIALIE